MKAKKKDKSFSEKRRHKRYKIKNGAYIAIEPCSSPLIGQILDISMDGLCFQYIDWDKRSNLNNLPKSTSTILLYDNLSSLDSIPIRIIDDYEVKNEILFSTTKMRKCHIQFTNLYQKQKDYISCFMKKNIFS